MLKRVKHPVWLMSVLLMVGCSRMIDSVAVPLNNATVDINQSSTLPLDNATLKIKDSGVALETNF